MPEAWQTTPSGLRRARGWGLPLAGTPGPVNAITDVEGVSVGYRTLIEGEGPLVVGRGPVRTGVTAILPRGRAEAERAVFAAMHSFNGAGEFTGGQWIAESGLLEGPLAITNTHSVGVVRDAIVAWGVERGLRRLRDWGLPAVGETYDGELNDIDGFHVTPAHVFEALDSADIGPLELGSIGGGTGMICYGYKGGSGSASRRVEIAGAGTFTLGVFVQANFGSRRQLVICGQPVGRDLDDSDDVRRRPAGSIIGILATDAPLLPHQLARLARRAPLGMARTGAVGEDGSGDIFLAFSTQPTGLEEEGEPRRCAWLDNARMGPLFAAAVEASEEAILDAMIANRSMTGRDGVHVPAIPDSVIEAVIEATGARHG